MFQGSRNYLPTGEFHEFVKSAVISGQIHRKIDITLASGCSITLAKCRRFSGNNLVLPPGFNEKRPYPIIHRKFL